MRFSSASSYKVTYSSFPNGACTIFIVFGSVSNSTAYRSAIFGPYGGSNGLHIGLDAGGGNLATFVGNATNTWNDANTNSPTTGLLNTYQLVGTTNSGGVLTPYANGTAMLSLIHI